MIAGQQCAVPSQLPPAWCFEHTAGVCLLQARNSQRRDGSCNASVCGHVGQGKSEADGLVVESVRQRQRRRRTQ